LSLTVKRQCKYIHTYIHAYVFIFSKNDTRDENDEQTINTSQFLLPGENALAAINTMLAPTKSFYPEVVTDADLPTSD